MSELVGVIASIPSRRWNLPCLLQDLAMQTRPLDLLIVIWNGGDPPPPHWCEWNALSRLLELPGPSAPTKVYVQRTHEAPKVWPAGERWKLVAHQAINGRQDATVLVIDDDFRVGPDYVARTIEWLLPEWGMTAWTGHLTPKRYVGLDRKYGIPILLWSGGTGACAVRARDMLNLCRHPFADECLGPGGDDEALVSLHLFERDLGIVRPPGRAPLRSVPSLQDAPDASHILHHEKWMQVRRRMIAAYDWKAP